ncbi:MAG: Nif3-like dinuclear metal center hexameric protein [Flavobacteriaceae bacterium]|nr:Nif3-like dinuclear metal center hexameric protein [Flavobacteriaceae bacterium]
MQLKEIIQALEQWAAPSLQESYDNSGLIVGDKNMELTSALICLDSTEAVVDEAIAIGANLIIAHHPIVFSGLKSFTGQSYIERVVMKAIKNDIAIYAIHTNLDNVSHGVNQMISRHLGLEATRILSPKKGRLKKLIVYTPESCLEAVRRAAWKAGAGEIGDYSECSFGVKGDGTFKPGEAANPSEGTIGKREELKEYQLEFLVEDWKLAAVLSGVKAAHTYEEVAHDIISLDNVHQNIGSGMIGQLPQEMELKAFFKLLKENLGVQMIKYTTPNKEKVKTIALCGGSGSFLLGDAIRVNADVFVTADFKYHQFFDAENKLVIADIGHYESEHLVKDWIADFLMQKFPTFAVRLTQVNTNPVQYF